MDNAEIQVVEPQDYRYTSDNRNFLSLRIEYGDLRCLRTGNAERDAEQDMAVSGQDLSCNVYVVGYHGSSSSTSVEVLDGGGVYPVSLG